MLKVCCDLLRRAKALNRNGHMVHRQLTRSRIFLRHRSHNSYFLCRYLSILAKAKKRSTLQACHNIDTRPLVQSPVLYHENIVSPWDYGQSQPEDNRCPRSSKRHLYLSCSLSYGHLMSLGYLRRVPPLKGRVIDRPPEWSLSFEPRDSMNMPLALRTTWRHHELLGNTQPICVPVLDKCGIYPWIWVFFRPSLHLTKQ